MTRRASELDIVAVPRARAASIAGLTSRRVDYWARQDIARPEITQRLGGRSVRLYGFADLMSLLIAAELRARGVSLQHIRKIVTHLRSRGYERPLTELRFATLGGDVYFQHPDGSWEGDLRADQVVMSQVLNLEPLHARIMHGIARPQEAAGRVERRRGTLGSKPVFAGTRIPVETVRRYLDAGRTTDEIIDAFPELTAADVRAAAKLVAV